MRGAVSAGMVAALKYIGLEDTFDVVYGSSAGAIVGAYFVSRQLPVYGAKIYYDTLCSPPENGERFIDLWALRHHPYLRLTGQDRHRFYTERTRPVLLLDRLIDDVMRVQCPLDWKAFQKMHKVQPLKPVASSLLEMRSRTVDNFSTFSEFLECLRASARVPGIAGNPVEIDGNLFADGLLFEPIPYRTALQDGCTDVLVLRTKPDTYSTQSAKPGFFENHIARPYFDRFPNLSSSSEISDYLVGGGHIEAYDNDIERLRRGNFAAHRHDGSAIFTITPPIDAPQMRQLESRARYIYQGVRDGFAATYNTLSPFATPSHHTNIAITPKGTEENMSLSPVRNAGQMAASWVFPDEELVLLEQRHAEARKRYTELNKQRRKDKRKLKALQKRFQLQRRKREKSQRREAGQRLFYFFGKARHRSGSEERNFVS